MTPGEEQELIVRPPGIFTRAFTVVGFFAAISGGAYLVAWIVTAFNERYDTKWTVFAIAWGLLARFFQWSVHRGIKTTLASDHSREERARVLGEQVWAIPFFRRVVEVELVASLVSLLVRLIS